MTCTLSGIDKHTLRLQVIFLLINITQKPLSYRVINMVLYIRKLFVTEKFIKRIKSSELVLKMTQVFIVKFNQLPFYFQFQF